jgi:hypothetical protein
MGMPDASQAYDPKYPAHFNPGRHKALECYLATVKLAAGDKFVLSMLHAGIDAHTLSVYAKRGCTGLTFHYELHDLLLLAAEANGGAASVAEVVFPTLTVDKAVEAKFDVRDIFGNAYFGTRAGTMVIDAGLPTEETVCCAKHKALVLVVDTLPAADAVPTDGCTSNPCNYGSDPCGSSAFKCFDIDAYLHVNVAMGLHAT